MEKYTFIPKVRILEIRSTRDQFHEFHENYKNWGKLRMSIKIIQKLEKYLTVFFGPGSIITILELIIQPFFESHFKKLGCCCSVGCAYGARTDDTAAIPKLFVFEGTLARELFQ